MKRFPFALLIFTVLYILGCDSNPASFEDSIPIYSLTTNVTPEDGGTIHPSGGEFTSGDDIVIEARAAEGFIFDRWENSMSGNANPDTLRIDENKTVTAHFSRRDYSLNIEISGEGAVHESVAETDTTDNSVKSVKLTAEAEEGWFFDRWEGDLSGSDNPEIVSVDEEKNITAVFDREIEDGYTITISIEGEGSVDRSPDRTYFAEGDEVILTANPESGWNFIEWRGDLSGSENSQTIIIEGNLEATAVFGPFEDPFLEITRQPSTTNAGAAITPAPEVKLADELGDPIEGAEIDVSLNNNSFASGSTTTVTTDANGIAAFDNLSIETAASGYILSFETDVDEVAGISSNPFEIVAAEADAATSSADVPSEVSVGESTEITISLEDAFGNVVTGAADDISVSVSGANSGSLSSSETGDGEYTASYTPTHAGTDEATISVNGSELPGSPFSIDVSGGSPSEMNITQQPSRVTAGSAISSSPAVRVLDGYGNARENIEVDVELEGGDFASGSTTSAETNSNGVAAFSNLVIHAAGSGYSLNFIANGLEKSSDSFEVVAASPDPSSSSAEVPSEGTVGESTEITISLEDAYGNVVTGTADDISVSVSGANSGSPSASEAGDGEYIANYTPTHAGTDQVTISVNGSELPGSPFSSDVSGGAPSEMNITQQPSRVAAGSAISSSPAVRVLDAYGNALENIEVSVELEGGDFASGSTTSVETNSNGVAAFSNLVIHAAGSGYSLNFIANGLEKSSDGFEVVAASPDPSSSSAEVPDGMTGEETDITIVLEDQYGNAVAGAESGISVDVSGSNNASPSVSETGTAGKYTASYTPQTAGMDQVEIRYNGSSIDGSPFSSTVEPADSNPSNSAVTADPDELKVGETSTVTIEARDDNGNPIGGISSSDFVIGLDGDASAGPVNETSSTGNYEFDVTSEEVGEVTITVTIHGITLFDRPIITFEAGDPHEIIITVQPEDTQSGQPIEGPPTVRVIDEFGHEVPGVDVRVREEGGHVISSGNLVVRTDESGIAVFDNLVIHTRVRWFYLVFSVDGVDEVVSERFRVSFLERSTSE